MLCLYAHYESKQPLKLACDASSYEVGAVLSRVFKDGEHLIAFASQTPTHTKTKHNYGQIKKSFGFVFWDKKIS